MGHVTRANQSCHTSEFVIAQILEYTRQGAHVVARVLVRHNGVLLRQVTHMNGLCHTYEWVMSLIQADCECGMSPRRSRTSCHTHEWVMSHTWVSHIAYMSGLWFVTTARSHNGSEMLQSEREVVNRCGKWEKRETLRSHAHARERVDTYVLCCYDFICVCAFIFVCNARACMCWRVCIMYYIHIFTGIHMHICMYHVYRYTCIYKYIFKYICLEYIYVREFINMFM